MKVTLRIGSLTACFLAIVQFTTGASAPSSGPDVEQPAQVRPSGLMTRITMRDGATRTVKLERVGCAQSICSRTAIKAKTEGGSLARTWFDSLAAIRDTTANDALFVLKDGTSHRMSLVNDFRVLYLATRLGGTERLDLAKVRRLSFLPGNDRSGTQ